MVGGARTEQMAQWGAWIAAERARLRISKRAAAKRAGISEGSWRIYEAGGMRVGSQWTPANPETYSLHRIAAALGVAPEEVFRRAGRPFDANEEVPGSTAALVDQLNQLQDQIAQMRDQLLQADQ